MNKMNLYTSVIVSSFLSLLGIGIILFMVFIPLIQNNGIVIIDANAYGEMWYEFITMIAIFIISVICAFYNFIVIFGEINYR